MRAERETAGTVSDRRFAGDLTRWVLSGTLAVLVVALLLMIGMLI